MGGAKSTYEIVAKMSGVSQVTSGFDKIYQHAQRTTAGIHQVGKASDRVFGSMGGFRFGSLRSGIAALREFSEEALKFSQAQQRFRVLNLSESENQRAFKAVRDTVNNLKGANLTDTMETLVDIHGAVGDLHHALAALPSATKYRVGFESLFGDRFSKEEIEQQIQAAMKYLEVTGAVAQGEKVMEERFNVMAQMVAGSSGRTTPAMLLQMARRAGPAAQGLSIAGMRNMSGIVQELGGEGAGTALMSMYQTLTAGVMKQSAANEFMRLGLLDPHKIEYGHAQKIKRLLPGANALGPLLQEDPLKAADALMEAMKKPLHGKAIDTTNANKVREELSILFGNRTAQKLMSILTTQRGQVVKEAALAAHAKNIEQLYNQALDTPAGKLKTFENNLRNVQAELGGPLLSALTEVRQASLPFLRFASAHPQLALMTLAVFKLAGAASMLRSSGLPSMLKDTFGLLFGRGAAGAATKATAGALTKAEAEALLFGSGGAQAAGRVAGAGLAGGLVSGLIGAVSLVISASLLKQIWDESEDAGKAKELGRSIGQLISEGAVENISGIGEAIDATTRRRMLQTRRLAIFARLGELAGNPQSETGGFLSKFEETRRLYNKGKGLPENAPFSQDQINEYKRTIEPYRKFAAEIQGYDFKNIEELSAYLKSLHEALKGRGEENKFAAYEQAILELYPQFTQQYKDLYGALNTVMSETGQIAPSVIDALRNINEQLRQLGAYGPVAPGPGGGTGGGEPYGPPDNPFAPKPYRFPSRAIGGVVEGDGFAKVHRGNLITPARITRGLSDAHIASRFGGMMGSAHRAATQRDIHLSISVDARGASDPAAVQAAVRAGGQQIKAELYSMLMNEMDREYKDRSLGIP